VPMVLTARMGFIPRAGTTPAFMDLSWHASVSSPSERLPALYAIRPLDRKPPNPEVVFLHALSPRLVLVRSQPSVNQKRALRRCLRGEVAVAFEIRGAE
jgi:hypothetical protein